MKNLIFLLLILSVLISCTQPVAVKKPLLCQRLRLKASACRRKGLQD